MKGADRTLRILLDHPGRWMTAEELALRLGVTQRSVRNYVARINKDHDGVVKAGHQGYRLDSAAGMRAAVPSTSQLTPQQRLDMLLQTLVTAPGKESIYDLSERFFVSDSTIEQDLTKIRPIVATYDLRLAREREWISVDGAEKNRRRLMRRLLIGVASKRPQVLDVEALATAMGQPELPKFRKTLRELFARQGLALNQLSGDELVAHVAIMIQRIRGGYEFEGEFAEIEVPDVCTDVVQLIESTFGVTISAPEYNYLALLVTSKVAPLSLNGLDERLRTMFFEADYVEFVHTMVGDISENYLIDLHDERFCAFLALHIKNLVERARQGEVVHVSSGQTIKDTHPLIYEISIYIAREIERAFDVTVVPDEISLISFHVGAELQKASTDEGVANILVVVPRYYQLADSVAMVIEKAAGGKGVVTQVVDDLESVPEIVTEDLIVTTTALRRDVTQPVVHIHPLVSDADMMIVHDYCEKIVAEKQRARVHHSLQRLTQPSLFIRHTGPISYDDALAEMVEAAQREGLVDDGFLDAVRERERIVSTALPSGVAIPHAMEPDAPGSGLVFFVNDEPFDWGGKPVTLAVLLVFDRSSRQEFTYLLERLIKIFISEANIEKLTAASTSYAQFLAQLQELV